MAAAARAGSCPPSWAEVAAAAVILWSGKVRALNYSPRSPFYFVDPLLDLQLIVKKSCVLADADGG